MREEGAADTLPTGQRVSGLLAFISTAYPQEKNKEMTFNSKRERERERERETETETETDRERVHSEEIGNGLNKASLFITEKEVGMTGLKAYKQG